MCQHKKTNKQQEEERTKQEKTKKKQPRRGTHEDDARVFGFRENAAENRGRLANDIDVGRQGKRGLQVARHPIVFAIRPQPRHDGGI